MNDLTGKRFGKWTVVRFDHKSDAGKIYWLCHCDCGTMRNVRQSNLVTGYSLSCGCYKINGRKRPRVSNLRKYIAEKIHLLCDEMCLILTDEELSHLYECISEEAVDQYAHDLIMKYL